MTTAFPGALDSFTTKVDAVDYVLAAHVNNIQDSIIALETYAFDKGIGPNLLYSTLSHDIWPAGVTFTGILDDVYANLWNSLHSGITPTITGVAGGSTDPFKRYLKFANGGTAYGGIVQFLSSEDTTVLRGLPVSISADLWGTNITTVRMAVISWTSTADVVTSDVVGVWGTGNPTLATNWAYIGTPADITITTTRTRFQVDNLTVPTTANNLALFIWIPNQEASGDFFNVARVKLEKGTVATEFVAPPFSEEQALQNHFMQVLDATLNTMGQGLGSRTGTTTLDVSIPLQPMRVAPALVHNITGYGTGSPTTTLISVFNYAAGAIFLITGALTVGTNGTNKNAAIMRFTAGTSWDGTTGNLAALRIGASVVAIFDARL